jgi:hypothetical protein
MRVITIKINNKEYEITPKQLKKLENEGKAYEVIDSYEYSENDYNSIENKRGY